MRRSDEEVVVDDGRLSALCGVGNSSGIVNSQDLEVVGVTVIILWPSDPETRPDTVLGSGAG